MKIRSTAAVIATGIMLHVFSAFPASAQVSVGFGVSVPGVSIGINLPVYPDLEPIPGYPVYYAPGLDSNFFFYDGMYWSFVGDQWYASTWYDGPWYGVGPAAVPLYVLRVPVRYYRRPPAFFRGWRADVAPRWGDHWGPQWQTRRSGWDRWDPSKAPGRAPLPVYQRSYSRDRYPGAVQQRALRNQYQHQPRDPYVKRHFSSDGARQQSPQKSKRPVAGAARGSRDRNTRSPQNPRKERKERK